MTAFEIKQMEHKTILKTAQKGDYIYIPEDSSTYIYFLIRGYVKLGTYSGNGKENTRTIVRPSEVFGELSVADEQKRTEFAKASTDNVIIRAMYKADMQYLMQTVPGLSLKIAKLMAYRLIRIEKRVEEFMFKDARTRIIDMLREISNKNSANTGDNIMANHQLTHQDIGNLTATSRQTVTTILNQLKTENLIYYKRNNLVIRGNLAVK